ncbi:MAG: molybdenum ABC transporter ATP-binding protein [Gemmatimonadetes bacterium]|nr:molybdenum ABC transporter ATP-binding protein [Gemmatimonadota bacterium]
MIRVSDLRVSTGSFRLRGMSLDLPTGAYGAIVGPTGAGKTLLLEAIAGLQPMDSGAVFAHGEDLSSAPPEHRRLGYVPQDRALFPHMSVARNIAFGLDDRAPDNSSRVSNLVGELGIAHLVDRRPSTLSGGEAQRVALARALAPDPPALLLDEPLTGLDPATRLDMISVLRNVHRSMGTTILHVTHEMEEALALADHLGVIRGGRILQWGPLDSVYDHPMDESVARSVGVDNLLRAKVDRAGRMVAAGFDLRGPNGLSPGSALVAIRAGNVLVMSAESGRGQPARVSSVRRRSRDLLLRLLAPGEEDGEGLLASISPAAAREIGVREGADVRVAVDTEGVHVIGRR